MGWKVTEKGHFVLDSIIPTDAQRRALEDIRDHGSPSHRTGGNLNNGPLIAVLKSLLRNGWAERMGPGAWIWQ